MVLAAVLLLSACLAGEARADSRLYHLRVTLRSGERYETISTFDPINYCHVNGGSVIYLRDYSVIYSREMKVKVLRTWIDPAPDLAGRWRDVLRANRMLAHKNHRPLARVKPPAPEAMMIPE